MSLLRSSFVIGRKLISTLTNQNAVDMVDFRWRKLSKIDLALYEQNGYLFQTNHPVPT